MSEFQKTMGRLQEMISRSNELVEIKKEAGKIAFQKGLEKGRVEGAKIELQNCIKDLEASLEFYECDYGKFEQQVVDKVIEELTENINKFKKRLKEKEVKGVN